MSTPVISTATRAGSRVRVTRVDAPTHGAQPLVSIVTDDGEILHFAPITARVVANMLLRAAAEQVTLGLRITNSYPELDELFVRTTDVVVVPPRDGQVLDDWAAERLSDFTGEGERYSSTHGVYEVVVTRAAAPFDHLVGESFEFEG